jgi:2-polyprenyl-3-methyl-5-hydroxy-6-metoxy-1,4-benzoquinol methylase
VNNKRDRSTEAVRDYWDSHTLGKQYVKRPDLTPGTREFFDHVRPWISPFKFPWIMERIEREAAIIGDGKVLEIGCGMGFASLEFIRRGCRVTATDLTPSAIEITRQHYEVENVVAEDVRVENVLDLSFADETFDAVWANGVLHHTGDTRKAIQEIRRVLKPDGRAIISHFYRRPSWMYWVSKLGRENIEFKSEDPPVTDFLTEAEVLDMFDGFQVEMTDRDHYRALPIARSGLKAFLYTWVFAPIYNIMPKALAKKLAYKFSVTAVKA